MVDIALRENPFSKEETVIVGDRFYTDIACGNASGVETVLVLTGEAKKTDTMINTYTPTYIFDSIKEVKESLEELVIQAFFTSLKSPMRYE